VLVFSIARIIQLQSEAMKLVRALLVSMVPQMLAGRTTPVSKVLDMLSNLQAKITEEGIAAKKAHEEFSAWCDERSKNVGFEIKTGESDVSDLEASIDEQTAVAASLSSKIEQLASDLAVDDADLTAAEQIRVSEASDFNVAEKELTEVVSTLERAISILEREMQKGGASALQLKNAINVAQALTVLVQASALSSADAGKLTALIQNARQATDTDEDSQGAPAAAPYQGHSDSIIETLEDILDKAQAQLRDARKTETEAIHNFAMLKQSLEDEIKFATQDVAAAKKSLSESSEKRGAAEGDVALAAKDLAADKTTLADLRQTCETKTRDFEAATKSRAEEMKALAEARKAISETAGSAESITYKSDVSFLQFSSSRYSSAADLAQYEAERLVRDLARKHHAPELAQLASRIASAMRSSGTHGDPFAKVKNLISDMIEKLENDAGADASHKAYCDKSMSESQAKRDEHRADVDKLSTKIDQMSARSAHLKEQVASLQTSLAEIASSQQEIANMRREEHSAFVTNKADMEQGLEGVRMALKILREYYAMDGKAHDAADGAATSIVGLLEVVESDFSKGLAEMMATEETSQAAFEQEKQENKIEATSKTKSVEYKQQEAVRLDKGISEANSDRMSGQAELDAVTEYLVKLESMCTAKPDTYEERKQRREAEIEGLKQALSILEGEAVLVQQEKGMLRGVKPHLKRLHG
jgi:chromosome segregation ATPase